MLAVTSTLDTLVSLYPPYLRPELEKAMPSLALEAGRLALEVLAAEANGIPYKTAIARPDFALMARVHHGLLDLLQWRLSPELREGVRYVVRRVAEGDVEPFRRVIFAMAARRGDPEAALARFMLFEAVRLNLYVRTWDSPQLEAWGCIDRIEDDAERIVSQLLNVPEMFEEDTRPLNVLVAESLLRLHIDASNVMDVLRQHVGDVIDDMMLMTDATRIVRALDAPDAAAFRPMKAPEPLGSQQIADRFPWHFPSANAVEKRRSRFRARFDPDEPPEPSGNRLIDVLADAVREEETEK